MKYTERKRKKKFGNSKISFFFSFFILNSKPLFFLAQWENPNDLMKSSEVGRGAAKESGTQCPLIMVSKRSVLRIRDHWTHARRDSWVEKLGPQKRSRSECLMYCNSECKPIRGCGSNTPIWTRAEHPNLALCYLQSYFNNQQFHNPAPSPAHRFTEFYHLGDNVIDG